MVVVNGVAEDYQQSGGRGDNNGDGLAYVLDIYPLRSYYFGSKEALALKNESIAEMLQRFKAK